MVTAAFFLERYHFFDVWLLGVLDIIKALADLILLVLALKDEAVEQLDGEVGVLLAIGFVMSHSLKFLMQIGPLFKRAIMVIAKAF